MTADMDAPIEKAARAWFDRGQAGRLDAGRKREDGRLWQWEDLTESDRIGYRAIVRPIVAAIADDLREQAVMDYRREAFETLRAIEPPEPVATFVGHDSTERDAWLAGMRHALAYLDADRSDPAHD